MGVTDKQRFIYIVCFYIIINMLAACVMIYETECINCGMGLVGGIICVIVGGLDGVAIGWLIVELFWVDT